MTAIAMMLAAGLLAPDLGAAAEEPDAGQGAVAEEPDAGQGAVAEAPDAGLSAPPLRQPLRWDGGEQPAADGAALPTPGSPQSPATEAPPAPADPDATRTRHVPGPHGFAGLDSVVGTGTFVNPQLYAFAAGALRLHPGWGFALGPVKLSASADWTLAWEYTLPDIQAGRQVGWSDLALQVSAPEVLRVPHVNLSVTPLLGVTVPLASTGLLTAPTLGLRVEWSYQVLELGYFVEGGHLFYLPPSPSCLAQGEFRGAQLGGGYVCFLVAPQWTLSNALQLEVRPLEQLSFGARLSLQHQWRLPSVPLGPDERLPPGATGSRATERFSALLFVSFSIIRSLGLTLDVSSTAVPRSGAAGRAQSGFAGLFFANPADNNTRVGLSLWFRTNPGLSRYWLL